MTHTEFLAYAPQFASVPSATITALGTRAARWSQRLIDGWTAPISQPFQPSDNLDKLEAESAWTISQLCAFKKALSAQKAGTSIKLDDRGTVSVSGKDLETLTGTEEEWLEKAYLHLFDYGVRRVDTPVGAVAG